MSKLSKGAVLKVDVTKDHVEAFCNGCIVMRSFWHHFHILFEGAESQRRLLQSIAPILFRDINGLFIEHLILQICKITDPEESKGRKNLTVKYLLNNADFSNSLVEQNKLKKLVQSIDGFRNKILPARNKFIGHLDLSSVLDDKPLGAATADEWNQFWLDLQDFLNIIHKRYVDPLGVFYLNAIGNLSDAHSLIRVLEFRT